MLGRLDCAAYGRTRCSERSPAQMSGRHKPVSPGEMLAEFLPLLGMSNYRLAKEIDVPAQHIGEIAAGKRAITAHTDLRLCRFFGLSDGRWLRLQADYDTEVAKGEPREDQAVEGSQGKDGGCALTFCFRAGAS